MKKENDILEKTLDIAESGYDNAYQFLLEAYKNAPENYGPQTLYFLSCLAGGAGFITISAISILLSSLLKLFFN